MKTINYLSFGNWSNDADSVVNSAADSLFQSIDLAQAAEAIGIGGAYFRVHHFGATQSSPFPLLSTIAARTSTLEVGTGVLDMRYENPLYLAEESASLDIISGERLQLGISRGSPEFPVAGYTHFGYTPDEGQDDGDLARAHTATFFDALRGEGFARRNTAILPEGDLLPISPHSPHLSERIWWGAGSLPTAVWAAQKGMHLLSSTVIMGATGAPFEELQLAQIRAFRSAWSEAGWNYAPKIMVARSIVPIVDDRSRAYAESARGGRKETVGAIDGISSRFGRSIVGEPDLLVEELAQDVAVADADMVIITIPNELGVEFNTTMLSAIHAVGGELGWNSPQQVTLTEAS